MKKIFSALVLTIVFSLRAMEQEETKEKKDFSSCYLLKVIDSDAPQSEYRELVKKLRKKNLSTCKCISYLIEEKQQRAIDLLCDNGFSNEKTCNNLNKLRRGLKRDTLKKSVPLLVHFPPKFELEMQQDVRDEVIKHHPSESLRIEHDFEAEGAASARTDYSIFSMFATQKSDVIEFYKPAIARYNLFIKPMFRDFSKNERSVILLHEKQHLLSNHSFINVAVELVVREALKPLRSRPENQIDWDKILLLSGIIAKIELAQEAEADRIPAACNSLLESYSFLSFWESVLLQLGNGIKDDHPSNLQRYIWGRRLYRLKREEELEFPKGLDETMGNQTECPSINFRRDNKYLFRKFIGK